MFGGRDYCLFDELITECVPIRQLNNWEYPYRYSNLFLLKAKEGDL